MAADVFCVVLCWCMWRKELNSPEPPREGFRSGVQECLHCLLVCKALLSLGPINTSGNLNKVDEKFIISSGDLDTENCMVFAFLRGIWCQGVLRSALAAFLKFAFANRSSKRFSAQLLLFPSCQTSAASSTSLGWALQGFQGIEKQSQRGTGPFFCVLRCLHPL